MKPPQQNHRILLRNASTPSPTVITSISGLLKIIVSLCSIWMFVSCYVSIQTMMRRHDDHDHSPNHDHHEERIMMATATIATTTTSKQHVDRHVNQSTGITSSLSLSSHSLHRRHCAILFWGLPRTYRTLVLPSIVQNIIYPNHQYQCDYYIHYYHQHEETAGRSGLGGTINPNDIWLLHDAIRNITNDNNSYQPIIQFYNDTEEQFWKQYQNFLDTIRTTKDPDGNYLYFPWKAKTYQHPTTTDNIIKMWHSIQSVWNMMEYHHQNNKRHYQQIGMFRSDVVYLTPIDIYENPTHTTIDQPFVVIPNFGNYPVSDRLIYGCYDGVKIWATYRFRSLEDHIQWMYHNDIGWGLHSERYMNYTIFPYIRSNGTKTITSSSNSNNDDNHHHRDVIAMIPHPTLCFVRSRSDESIWMNDCIVGLSTNQNKKMNKKKKNSNHENPPSVVPVISDPRIYESLGGSLSSIQQRIENIIGHRCTSMKAARRNVVAINCSSSHHP